MNIYKYNLWLLCLLLFSLAACQSRRVNPNPPPDLSFSNEGLVGYEKLDGQPGDLGWPSVSYAFVEAQEQLVAPKAVDSYSNDLSSIYNPIDPKTGYLLVHDSHSLHQFLEVFSNEVDSMEYFEGFKPTVAFWGERPELSSRFQPQIENLRYGCRVTQGGQCCNVVMQYGRFITNAGMLVDGQNSTFEDWENALIAMQARLIAYAEEEQNNQ